MATTKKIRNRDIRSQFDINCELRHKQKPNKIDTTIWWHSGFSKFISTTLRRIVQGTLYRHSFLHSLHAAHGVRVLAIQEFGCLYGVWPLAVADISISSGFSIFHHVYFSVACAQVEHELEQAVEYRCSDPTKLEYSITT